MPYLLVLALMVHSMSILQARAAEPSKVPRAVFLFDGSGSMWGKLNGQRASKLTMAQVALGKGIPALRLPLHLGLMTFGNRQVRSCEDVRMLVSPAADGGQRVLQAVPDLNPQGRGPLTLGLRKAAEGLQATRGPASIILIHDGPDNCSQDTCTAIRELKAAHRDLVVHVISLGLDPKEFKRISCVSAATGGQHFKVSDQSGFDVAIHQTMKLAALRSGVPVRVPQSPAAKAARPDDGKPGLRLSAMLEAGGPPIGAGLRWRIVSGGASKKAKSKALPVYQGDASRPFLDLKPGTYSVTVQLGQASASGNYKVAAKGKTTANLVLDAGTVHLKTLKPRSAVQPPAAAHIGDIFYTVTRKTEDAAAPHSPLVLSRADTLTLHLPAGSYIVKAERGVAQVERAITVEAGGVANIDLVLNMGELALSAHAAKGAEPEKGVFFFVLR